MNDQTVGVVVAPMDVILSYDGLSFLQAMIAGRLPAPPITETLGFALVEVEHGRAAFAGTPRFAYYNPINVVHGGWAATLLDSALGCAVITTLDIKVNLVRAITTETGRVFADASILHRGRTIATAEAYLRDEAGKLYAHGTTTCAIFPAQAGKV